MIDKLGSPYIYAATSENFKALVLENSQRGPVLVNFWSRKAGPCLRQYPVLDQLIHHYDGRVLLINVDTESEFVFTKEYAIASVPTLKLFRQGRVVETWHGYQPEAELKKILEGYVTRDSDLKLADAVDLFAGGNARAAYEMIAELIVVDPVNPRLPLTMCKLLRHEGRYAEAIKLIATLPPEIRQHKEIQQFDALLGFYAELNDIENIAGLEEKLQTSAANLELKRQFVAHLVAQQQYEAALQRLVEMMETEQAYADNYAQQAMLKIFMILGSEHPLVSHFRPNLKRYVH